MRQQCLRRGRTAHVPVDILDTVLKDQSPPHQKTWVNEKTLKFLCVSIWLCTRSNSEISYFLHIVIQERQILSVVNPLPVSENDVLCLNCNQMCSISIPHIIQWPFSSSHIDWQIIPIDSSSPFTSSGICGMSIPIIRIIYLSDIKFTDFFNAYFWNISRFKLWK